MPDCRSLAADAFCEGAGWAAAKRRFLAGDASARQYYRLGRPDGTTAVLMDAPPGSGEDLSAFLRIAAHLRSLHLSAPAVLAADEGAGFLLLEDLGDRLFARVLEQAPEMEAGLYLAASEVIARVQSTPPLDGLPVYDSTAMGEAVAPAITFYRRAFSGQAGDPEPLCREMRVALDALPPFAPVMILRDYHAENLLWLPEREGLARVGVLDFQLAMISHPAYDLVSLLQDARRDISRGVEEDIIARFAAERGQDAAGFRRAYHAIGAQRHLRILGIFARLALVENKTGYLVRLPRVWRDLMRCLADPSLEVLRRTVADLLPEPLQNDIQRIEEECRTRPTA